MRTEAGFETTEVLSDGTLSSVWRAHHPARRGQFLIKECQPEPNLMEASAAKSFLVACEMRARLLEKLSAAGAEHWVRVHEVSVSPEQVLHVCDYHPTTLKRLLEMRIRIDVRALHQLASGVVTALRELERIARRSHGNLKPSNILLTLGPRAQIRGVALTDPHGPSGSGLDDRYELGRLICAAVLGHEVDPSELWPIPSSPQWSDLGPKADAWRELCNRLLHPDGYYTREDLDKIDNEIALLAPESPRRRLLAVGVAAAIVAVAVAGAAIYFSSDGGEEQIASQRSSRPPVSVPIAELALPATLPTTAPIVNPPTTVAMAATTTPSAPINPPPPPVAIETPATSRAIEKPPAQFTHASTAPTTLAKSSPSLPQPPTSSPATREFITWIVAPDQSATPGTDLARTSAKAKTIVFLCDASGSMIGLPFDLLRIELKKAVGALNPTQAFNIMFFPGDDKSFSTSLLVANPRNKQKVDQYLKDVVVGAHGDPIQSVRRAFAQAPDLLYLLSDSAFDDNDAVIREIRTLNASKKTKVFTIAFFSSDQAPVERKACEEVLRTIASENGGTFKVVLTSDLLRDDTPAAPTTALAIAPRAIAAPPIGEPSEPRRDVALTEPPSVIEPSPIPAPPDTTASAPAPPPLAIPPLPVPRPPAPATQPAPQPPQPVLMTTLKDRANPNDRYASVVLIGDVSAPMNGALDPLRMQLTAAIDDLQSEQSFNVFLMKEAFVKDHPLALLEPKRMLPATPQNKQRAKDFINANTASAGTTRGDPSDCVDLAFRQKAQLIYLAMGRPLGKLEERTLGQKFRWFWKNFKMDTRVNTIGIFPENLSAADREAAARTLESLARQGNGRFELAESEKSR